MTAIVLKIYELILIPLKYPLQYFILCYQAHALLLIEVDKKYLWICE